MPPNKVYMNQVQIMMGQYILQFLGASNPNPGAVPEFWPPYEWLTSEKASIPRTGNPCLPKEIGKPP